MKKIAFLLFFALLTTTASGEETYSLKLRAGYHPEFLRIVLEGDESIISKGVVNQKGQDIIVRFPNLSFTIFKEKAPITFKTDKDTIWFSTGYFRKLKVFSLKYPSRLVLDVYIEREKRRAKPLIDIIRKPRRKDTAPSIKPEQPKKASPAQKTKIVVIDPGHGGYETGLVEGIYKEKNVVLDISKRLSALINRGAAQSFLTRKSDQFMSLGERAKFTNTKNAEIFLSLHVGRHSDIVLYSPVITESVPYEIKAFLNNKGQEDYILKTATLNNALKHAIAEDFDNDMVSTKPLPYSILSRIEAAALIIELPSFEDAYYDSELKAEFANTIYKGLYLYEEETAK